MDSKAACKSPSWSARPLDAGLPHTGLLTGCRCAAAAIGRGCRCPAVPLTTVTKGQLHGGRALYVFGTCCTLGDSKAEIQGMKHLHLLACPAALAKRALQTLESQTQAPEVLLPSQRQAGDVPLQVSLPIAEVQTGSCRVRHMACWYLQLECEWIHIHAGLAAQMQMQGLCISRSHASSHTRALLP